MLNGDMEKIFISADSLLKDSFELALRVYESGFRPSFILGVWRGGAPIALATHELYESLGARTDHGAVRTSSYGGGTVSGEVEVFGLRPVLETLPDGASILIVDDTFDTGRSVDAVITELRDGGVDGDVRIATVYYKPTLNKTSRAPDYYLHETDRWLVFPHEIRGLSRAEAKARGSLPIRIFDRPLSID